MLRVQPCTQQARDYCAVLRALGKARDDINGDDLFALMAGHWVGQSDQPSFAPRAEHLSRIVAKGIF